MRAMPKVPEAHRLRPLLELALNEGWIVCSLNDGELKLVKPGLSPIFTRATALLRCGTPGAWGGWHV
jgi:hypothetical protein